MRIPAGTYYLGDPCYVFGIEWSYLLDSSDFFENPEGFTPDGTRVVAFGTAYGDGTYSDQFGNQYSVDAGLIGLVPYSEALETSYGKGLWKLGTKVVFYTETTATEDNGVLFFGKYRIDTN